MFKLRPVYIDNSKPRDIFSNEITCSYEAVLNPVSSL